MSNEIKVRVNKGEYNPGEDICGAVYLQIVSPTAGTGIHLDLQVYEEFTYRYRDVPVPINGQRQPEYATGKKYYLHLQSILHKTSNNTSYRIGHFKFPFMKTLPTEVPGSFYMKGETTRAEWEAEVKCKVTANVIDAQDLQDAYDIVIKQSLPASLRGNNSRPKAKDVACPVRYLLFFKKNLHVTARLKKNVFKTGDPLALRIIITNPTTVTVTSLTLQLFREVMLVFKGGSLLDMTDECVVQSDNRTIEISPEKGHYLVVKQEIHNNNSDILSRALDNVLLPLQDLPTRKNFPPSVRGDHIKCKYLVHIEVKLSNNSTVPITLDVPVITAEDSKEWKEWDAPDWLTMCETKHTEDVFSVPDHVLRSESFLNVPGFQFL